MHGRFQPFHNGHKFLVDKMLEECDLGVILIGSVGKDDERNVFDMQTRMKMAKNVYKDNDKLFVGANLDLEQPYSEDAQWDVVFASCVLSLTGHLPTHIYTGDDYSVHWNKVKPEIKQFERHEAISATEVRKYMQKGNLEAIGEKVPKEVFEMIKEL